LETPLDLTFDFAANTFKIEKYEELVKKVMKHRMKLKDFVENSSVADNTIFE